MALAVLTKASLVKRVRKRAGKVMEGHLNVEIDLVCGTWEMVKINCDIVKSSKIMGFGIDIDGYRWIYIYIYG
jgi:hypothetical protein